MGKHFVGEFYLSKEGQMQVFLLILAAVQQMFDGLQQCGKTFKGVINACCTEQEDVLVGGQSQLSACFRLVQYVELLKGERVGNDA